MKGKRRRLIAILAIVVLVAVFCVVFLLGGRITTPLYDAVEQGNLSRVKKLLASGADPNRENLPCACGHGTSAVDLATALH